MQSEENAPKNGESTVGFLHNNAPVGKYVNTGESNMLF